MIQANNGLCYGLCYGVVHMLWTTKIISPKQLKSEYSNLSFLMLFLVMRTGTQTPKRLCGSLSGASTLQWHAGVVLAVWICLVSIDGVFWFVLKCSSTMFLFWRNLNWSPVTSLLCRHRQGPDSSSQSCVNPGPIQKCWSGYTAVEL